MTVRKVQISRSILLAIAIAASGSVHAADVSIVFDGSASMCGYFVADNSARILPGLIRDAMILRGSSPDNQVLSLRQRGKGKVSAKTDLTPVAPEFQRQAEVLAQQGKKAAGCAPFDGIGSNLELIFDNQSGLSNSKAVILITDAQLVEGDRDVFLRGYQAWAEKSLTEGKTPYAGYIVAQTAFTGSYYPIADPVPARRASGYAMTKHNRPLAMFWFVKGEEAMLPVYKLAQSFEGGPAVVQHLLPWVQAGKEKPAMMKAPVFSPDYRLPQLLADAGKISKIERYDTGRSESVIRSCIKPEIHGEELTLSARYQCADNRAFWDGINSLVYSIQPHAIAAQIQTLPQGWEFNRKTGGFDLVLDRKFKEKEFQVKLDLAPLESRISLANWSVVTDYCPEVDKKAEACVRQLQGRTYQLDDLSQQLANRSRVVTKELLAPVGKTTYKLELEFHK